MSVCHERCDRRKRWAPLRSLLVAAAALLAATGCSGPDPYAYKWDEFNRESPLFNKPLAVGQPVYVCYNGMGTTDLDVQKVAETKCAELGRTAVRLREEVSICPLLTPMTAIFRCDEVTGS